MTLMNGIPSWSLGGKRIAFVSGDMDVAGGHWRIYVMDADGGNQRRLSNDGQDDYYPSWSPDGKRIAFGPVGMGTLKTSLDSLMIST